MILATLVHDPQVTVSRCVFVEEAIMRPVAHGPRSLCPAGAPSPRRLDDEPSRLGVRPLKAPMSARGPVG
jgi:hypothetical protein